MPRKVNSRLSYTQYIDWCLPLGKGPKGGVGRLARRVESHRCRNFEEVTSLSKNILDPTVLWHKLTGTQFRCDPGKRSKRKITDGADQLL